MGQLQYLFIAAAVLCLSGCERHVDLPPDVACYETVTPTCLIDLATTNAAGISDPIDGVTAELEIAIAQHAAEREAIAATHIERAYQLLSNIEDGPSRAKTTVFIFSTAAKLDCLGFGDGLGVVRYKSALAIVSAMPDDHQRADMKGKLIAASGFCNSIAAVVDAAKSMPQSDETLASYKARTLHELAPIVAERSDLDAGADLTEKITMGLTYYQAIAANEVARIAIARGSPDIALQLLLAVVTLGDDELDGYFKAAIYREAAGSYDLMDRADTAQQFFERAIEATKLAPSKQQSARALSRVATVLSDFNRYDMARTVLPSAVEIAQRIDSDQLRYWSYYEIVGGAAFSGDFATASALITEIPETLVFSGTTLRSAAQRDFAWGYAKHGKIQEAYKLAQNIATLRERVQALSRIARLLLDENMHALPRYL